MQIDIFTLFPEWFEWFEGQRHISNSLSNGLSLRYINYRDYTPLTGGQVDDTPFGGGAGMVMRVDVVDSALNGFYGQDADSLKHRRRVIVLDPAGRELTDGLVNELSAEQNLTLLCGRYEGFDQRIKDNLVTDVVSIGSYVLSGGELAAMVLTDAVVRKLPGALGHEESALEESFSEALDGAPEYPHYTRPANYRGWDVPEILLSGHHQRIREWRLEQSRARMRSREPFKD